MITIADEIFEFDYTITNFETILIMMFLLCLNIYLNKYENILIDVIFLLFGVMLSCQIMILSILDVEITICLIVMFLFIVLNTIQIYGITKGVEK